MQQIIKKNFIFAILSITFLNFNSVCFAKEENCQPENQSELTIGTVQKEIHNGMAQDAVILALGSPNIVTKDSNGKETWVYDKISREVIESSSNKYGTLIILGAESNKAKYSSSQKTLTVVIKFNDKCLVDSFSYHSSKF